MFTFYGVSIVMYSVLLLACKHGEAYFQLIDDPADLLTKN